MSVQAWGLDIPSLLDEVRASMGFGDIPKRRLSG